MIGMHLPKTEGVEKISRYSNIHKGDIIIGDHAYETLRRMSYVRQNKQILYFSYVPMHLNFIGKLVMKFFF